MLVTTEYTYTILENYRGIDCVSEDISSIVYLAEGKENIINGGKSTFSFNEPFAFIKT